MGVSFRQKLITRLAKELDDIDEVKRRGAIDEKNFPDGVDLLPEFKNAHKSIRLSSNKEDFDKDSLMKKLMISRYNHSRFDPQLHLSQNRQAIIQMLGR